MKSIILACIVALISLVYSRETAVAQDSTRDSQTVKKTAETKTDKITPPPAKDAKLAVLTKEIVEQYLRLKNSLANDKTKDAATAGAALEAAFKRFDKKALTGAQKKAYEDIEDDAREHAEHIGANGGNIAHQREHFDMLSKDMYDLVKTIGSSQALYKDFCPMYNNKKGAIWMSESKAIKNPYYGKQMPTCGSVQEEIK